MMILDYSRAMMIECIMHVHGCSQPNPLAFRRWLEKLTYEELTAEYDKLELEENEKV